MNNIKMIKYRLNPRDCIVVERLMNGPATPTELSCPIVSTATITSIGDKLVKGGFAERVAFPNDRRKNLLRLTEYGREVLS